MNEFKTQWDYYHFAEYVKRESRYVMDGRQQRFLEEVMRTSRRRTKQLHRGDILWRSQIAKEEKPALEHTDNELIHATAIYPAPPSRMKPLRERATEGRVNPKGIPCLYLNTDKHTAMAEVRPWKGADVSLASFSMRRTLTLVDCSTESVLPPDIGAKQNMTREEKEAAVWERMNESFAYPVTPCDNVAEYAPTQILAEHFRSSGYDGIMYHSSLGSGKNVALFDLDSAGQVDCKLYNVEDITFKFWTVGED
jgi:hypothetical protein